MDHGHSPDGAVEALWSTAAAVCDSASFDAAIGELASARTSLEGLTRALEGATAKEQWSLADRILTLIERLTITDGGSETAPAVRGVRRVAG